MAVWICIECKREQPDQELQCVCGNILPEGFIEKDIHYEPPVEVKKKVLKPNFKPEIGRGEKPESPKPKTMVEKTPHVELKSKKMKQRRTERKLRINRRTYA